MDVEEATSTFEEATITSEEGTRKAQDLLKLLILGGLTLTKIVTNVPSILFQLEHDCKSP